MQEPLCFLQRRGFYDSIKLQKGCSAVSVMDKYFWPTPTHREPGLYPWRVCLFEEIQSGWEGTHLDDRDQKYVPHGTADFFVLKN